MKARLLWLLWALLGPFGARADEVIPPAPQAYFNDYAHVVSPAVVAELNQKLEQFERQTSIQIVVAIFPKMQSDSSIEDYTVRVAQSWHVGQKGKDNGAVLFVFLQDRKMYLQVGYGLEGALPDALAKRIIENEIKPYFRTGDYAGGLRAGVTAILQATQGEYQGTGRTAAERARNSEPPIWVMLFGFGWLAWILWAAWMRSRAGTVYTRSGRSIGYGMTYFGGGFSGGGSFSGGGGSFGGGGAGGSW